MREHKASIWLSNNFIMRRGRRHYADDFALTPEHHSLRCHHVYSGVGPQYTDLDSETLRIANVVGIHAGDKLPAGKTNCLI
jgi:hypothetical protein